MDRESVFLRAVLSGYPDRVARRREPGSASVLLASGTGATIAPESGVRDGEFIVALDISRHSPRQSAVSNRQSAVSNQEFAIIRIASLVDRAWLAPTASDLIHRFDAESGSVKAFAVGRYDALALNEQPVAPDPEIAGQLLADAWLARGPRESDRRLLQRLKFAGHEVDLGVALRSAAYGVKRLDDIDLVRAFEPEVLREVDREAPDAVGLAFSDQDTSGS